jgi:hypothetical protein
MTASKAFSTDALRCQDACNLSGVAHSLVRHLSALRDEIPSTAAINRHHATRVMVAKLADLAGLDYTYPIDSDLACANEAEG